MKKYILIITLLFAYNFSNAINNTEPVLVKSDISQIMDATEF
jgi:hypothetical protein